MKRVMGPILGFRGVDASSWQLSTLLVWKGDHNLPSLTVRNNGQSEAIEVSAVIKTFGDRRVCRYDFAVALSGHVQEVTYELSDSNEAWTFFVPAAGTAPRIAYASCNGFSSPAEMKKVDDKNERWSDMASKHHSGPYHLLLLGGDQVYADPIWETVPSIKRWSEMSSGKRNNAGFTTTMQTQVEKFYFDLYCDRWAQLEPAHMLASIPSLMMWDDHDIFDGWGSYPPQQQESDVFQGIYNIARDNFVCFQLRGARPSGAITGQDHFNYFHRIGDVAILALDMRSERSQSQVLSLGSWNAIYEELESLEGCKHLFVLTSIPVVHPDFGLAEKVLGVLPGQQELEDDLKDHWHSRTHKAERLRLIHRLFAFAKDKETRVTMLSGDVHVAAVGVIESQRAGAGSGHANVINQLTSSAIVHPAPRAIMSYALEFMSRESEQVDRGITAAHLEFPGTNRRFIMARNWLGLEPDYTEGHIWANWYVEGQTEPYTKVIHTARP